MDVQGINLRVCSIFRHRSICFQVYDKSHSKFSYISIPKHHILRCYSRPTSFFTCKSMFCAWMFKNKLACLLDFSTPIDLFSSLLEGPAGTSRPKDLLQCIYGTHIPKSDVGNAGSDLAKSAHQYILEPLTPPSTSNRSLSRGGLTTWFWRVITG